MPSFTRRKRNDGCNDYVFNDDARFTVTPMVKLGSVGVGGMVFGNYSYGDGSAKVTGWFVSVEGSRQMFSPGKLAECKAKVADPVWREWALSRVTA